MHERPPSLPRNENWLWRPLPRRQPRMRLFCFPFAGGSPTLFRGWPEAFADDVDVVGVRLPGRDMRIGEPPCIGWPDLVERLEKALANLLDIPFAMFGYSMGSMVAYELTQKLLRSGSPTPSQLILAACRAPHLSALSAPIANASFPVLTDTLRAIGGIPDKLDFDETWRRMFEPMIRADLNLAESWPYSRQQPLSVRIVSIAGADDIVAPVSTVQAWNIHAAGGYESYVLNGDHFFIRDRVTDLVAIVKAAIENDLSLVA